MRRGGWGGRTRVTIQRDTTTFKPEGIYAGVPYRVLRSGEIEAVLQGSTVRFDGFDHFVDMIGPGP